MKKKVIIIALVLIAVIGIVAAVILLRGKDEKPWKPSTSTTGSNYVYGTDDATDGDVTDDDTDASPDTDEVTDKETEKKPVSSETKKPETNKPETSKPETNKPETSKPVTEKPETTAPANEETTANEPSTEKPETDKKDEPVKNDPPVKNECSGGHSFGAWKEVSKATCTSTGAQIRTCKKCGVSERKTVNVKNHTEVKIPAVAATCANYGYTEGKKCSVCGTVTVSPDRLPMLSHSFSSWTMGKNATCSSEGYNFRTCKNCGYEEKDYIPATGKHSYVNGRCSSCGEEIKGTQGLTYTLSSDGTYYICTGFNSYSSVTTIVVPPYYNGKPVKEFRFVGYLPSSVKELILSEGIEKIGDNSLYSDSLRSVTIPNSCKYIYAGPFNICKSLETVYINTTGWYKSTSGTPHSTYREPANFSDPWQTANIFRKTDIGRAYYR